MKYKKVIIGAVLGIVVVALITVLLLKDGNKEKNKKNENRITWEVVEKNSGIESDDSFSKVYSDENDEYYVSDDTYIVYSNGDEYSIKDAIDSKKITIEDAEKKGVKVNKVSKSWYILDESSKYTCAAVITKIYEDSNYEYVVSNPCKAEYIYVVYSNGDKFSIKEALSKKKVTVEALIYKGVKITKTSKKVTWKIVDESSKYTCAAVITKIYEDSNYEYTVANPCMAEYIYVVYSNGDKFSIKEALSKKKVTVNDLIKKGVSISKKSKSLTWKIVDESSKYMCASVITKIYEDSNYVYSVSNPCKAEYIYVVYSNGNKISIKDALSKKKVTINDLIDKGVNIYKEKK